MKDLIIFAVLLFFLFMLMTKSDDKYGYNKYGYRKYGYNKNKKETVGGAPEDNDPNNMNDDENKLFNMIDTSNDGNIDNDEFYDFMDKEHDHSKYVTKDEFNEFKAHDHDDDDDDDSAYSDEIVPTKLKQPITSPPEEPSKEMTSKEMTSIGGNLNDIMGYGMDDNYNYL